MSVFKKNRRSLAQKKRRAKDKFDKGLILVFFKLIGLSLKILFSPFILFYYSFIKKEVGKNWRTFYRILFLVIIIFFVYIYYSTDN